MKIRVIENSFIPSIFGANGITLYPFIFIDRSKEQAIKDCLLQHECIHIIQIRSIGFLKFYFLYVKEYLVNLIRTRSSREAYLNISFELEAYGNQRSFKIPKEML